MTTETLTADSIAATQLLADFAADASFDDLSELALVRIREHSKDGLAVGLAAANEPPTRLITGLLAQAGAQANGAHVLGHELTVAPWDAAWANGTLCHMLDFDDYGFGHPTACILPAAVAVGEVAGSSGEDFALAMAIGWEVFDRLSRACRRYERVMRGRGIHPTSVYGAPAAAATAGKLIGLNGDQIAVAMGLGASASAGIIEQFGTWSKGIQAGNAARAGVMGALLAGRDYVGTKKSLEGPHGLFNALAGEGNYDLEQLAEGLGSGWAIGSPGFSLKLYPSCGGTVRAIDACIELHNEYVDDPAKITSIEISASRSILDSLHIDRPQKGFEGKFSLRYCVVAALADGEVTIGSFSDESLERPIIQQLLDRSIVHVRDGSYAPGPDIYRTPVTIALEDGASVTREIDIPRGHRDQRLTDDEIADKFMDCVRVVAPEADAEAINAIVDRLTSIPVSELMASLPRIDG